MCIVYINRLGFEIFLVIFIKKLLTKRKRCATIKVQRDREKERLTKVDRV